METELKELIERGITALEQLAKDPEITVQAFPAVCPHCQTMNPPVQVNESESTGRLAEFVVRGKCLMCSNEIYALPMQWLCVGSLGDAEIANKERAERLGYDEG